MSRKTHLFRVGSPSIRERNRELTTSFQHNQFLTQRCQTLEQALIILVKTFGDEVATGETALNIPDDKSKYPIAGDTFDVFEGHEGSMIMKVRNARLSDPDLLAQVAALQEEMTG